MIIAAAAVRACPGQDVSGDAALVLRRNEGCLVALIDGLGHGPHAAEAAGLAVETIRAHAESSPKAILDACHVALRRCRGAAISVIAIDATGNGSFAGIGNIRARILPEGHRQPALLPAAGVVGHQARSVRETTFRLPIDGIGLLHSDGVSTRVDPLAVRRAPIDRMAQRLLEDHRRDSDDASVVLFAHAHGQRAELPSSRSPG